MRSVGRRGWLGTSALLSLVLSGCGATVVTPSDGAGGDSTGDGAGGGSTGAECILGGCGDLCVKCVTGDCYDGHCSAEGECLDLSTPLTCSP